MTSPDNSAANAVVLSFIREELAGMRVSMHEELSGLRADFAELSKAMNANVTDHSSRLAVLEHQAKEHASDIEGIKTEGKTSKATRVTIALAVASAVLAWVPELVSAIGK